MSGLWSRLRQAAEQTVPTNLEVWRQIQAAPAPASPMAEKMKFGGACTGLAGILGTLGSAAGIQAATLSAPTSSALAALGSKIIAAGTLGATGVYAVPLIALGVAAVGAVTMVASKLAENNGPSLQKLAKLEDAAVWEPDGKKSPGLKNWLTGMKQVISEGLRQNLSSDTRPAAPSRPGALGNVFSASMPQVIDNRRKFTR